MLSSQQGWTSLAANVIPAAIAGLNATWLSQAQEHALTNEQPLLCALCLCKMLEYEKLTVVKLREELINRGLPKTGLKAALIQRLIEADAQSRTPDLAPAELPAEQAHAVVPANESATKDVALPTPKVDGVLAEESAYKKNDAPGPEEPKVVIIQDHSTIDMDVATSEVGIGTQVTLAPSIEAEGAASLEQALDKNANPTIKIATEQLATQQVPPDDILAGNLTRSTNSKEPETRLRLPTPDQAQAESIQIQDSIITVSTQVSATGEEMLEDSRKRKRRSQSPPPSSLDPQQRLKAKRPRPHIELPEDSTMFDAAPGIKSDHAPLPDSVRTLSSRSQTNGRAHTAEESDHDQEVDAPSTDRAIEKDVTPTQNGAAEIEEATAPEDPLATAGVVESTESPNKPSPSDTRFKKLFAAPSKIEVSAQKAPSTDAEDRIIGPALHPATSALYIRELMRPLKPENVKDHFAALATPPNTPVDANIITEFFLDSIRTHCLVGFASISAASRVRSGLHDRIWPNERDRRPLFVDFIPDEKINQWIDVEQNAPSGRGQPSKRWEVVYEDEEGEIKAYLQEVGTGGGGIRSAKPAKGDAGLGVQGAPSGPRNKEPDQQIVQPRADNGKGFQALDDLFRSTVAKPKLYYQPVPKAKADQRLDRLAAGRGGGRNDEMRRFSFEDDIIVDKGPEFGNRGRGGFGGRGGGFTGSYRARGGSYRGDSHRGGDSWRDRR